MDIFNQDEAAKVIDPQNKYVAVVEQCFQDHLPNSPASRVGAEAWATITDFVQDLKKRVQEA